MRTKKRHWLKLAVGAFALLVVTEQVLAASVGPFSFGFASSLLNNVFLLPLSLGGCLP